MSMPPYPTPREIINATLAESIRAILKAQFLTDPG